LFFPDTYLYHRGQTDLEVLRWAYERMQAVLEQEWALREEGLPYTTPYEALIMASIVEKETGAAHERGDIAGVFVRRLRLGMRLQTDPTVIYGLGDGFDGDLKKRHLQESTPYNTYVIPALPPTPIAAPGREAIHAALHPKPGTALFFVAKGDGTHQFSDTLKAHEDAVRTYQIQKRAQNYRSSPPPARALAADAEPATSSHP
ncbi:MAG: endolytic transglycosylase MltG, partial [Gammaproteobacteria bacterium]|nr:endolytic transglycosylase MltG [Gammaproteobacteria bacterium]